MHGDLVEDFTVVLEGSCVGTGVGFFLLQKSGEGKHVPPKELV